MIILGPKTAILGPQFCRLLVLGPHFWWSGGRAPGAPPGSAPDRSLTLETEFKENAKTALIYQSRIFL